MGIRHKFVSDKTDPGDSTVIGKTKWNDDHEVTDFVEFPSVSPPAAPAAGFLRQFAVQRAGRMLPAFVGPSGIDSPLQAAIFANRVATINPQRTTAVNVFGCGIQTAVTLSHPTIGSGSLAESIYRTRFQTSTTAGNASGVRSDVLAMRGNGTTARGGFFFAGRMCSGSISLAGGQKLFGLQGGNAALGGEPSALTNLLAIGKDIADTQWQFMRNDGSGSATKVSLGVSVANNQVFDLRIFCVPGGSAIYVLVEQIGNDGAATTLLDTSYTTDIPATTTALAMHCQVRNGSTAAADNIEMARMYMESDF